MRRVPKSSSLTTTEHDPLGPQATSVRHEVEVMRKKGKRWACRTSASRRLGTARIGTPHPEERPMLLAKHRGSRPRPLCRSRVSQGVQDRPCCQHTRPGRRARDEAYGSVAVARAEESWPCRVTRRDVHGSFADCIRLLEVATPRHADRNVALSLHPYVRLQLHEDFQ